MHSLSMLGIHSSSVQKSNMPDLYTNNGDKIVTAHMVLHWLRTLSKKQPISTSKRRAEYGSCVAYHVCLSSKPVARST